MDILGILNGYSIIERDSGLYFFNNILLNEVDTL